MKHRLFFLFILANFCVSAQEVNIIPKPVSVQVNAGKTTVLDSTFKLLYTTEEVLPEVSYFAEYFAGFCHFRLRQQIPEQLNYTTLSKGKHIIFEINKNQLPDTAGAYRLHITEKEIRITGTDRAGVFYGIQSLLQLIHANKPTGAAAHLPVYVTLPRVTIKDVPRFAWRGMHLDVCRHFFPKDFIKKYIDLLAVHKMNVLHWHLTDDQGWRIEIKKYPKLTEAGAWRNGSMVGHYNEHRVDSVRYGGFYTQAEIREIVQYASERHVTVVPEIEMPGHALAALTAYPELSCTGGPFEVEKTWGVFEDVFCAGNEKTFLFMQDVMDEVCDLFPGKYIHVGGDECPKERWKTCTKCQARIKNEKLKDEHGLQSYFIQRVEKYLNKKGRLIIGWDEILEGGLAPNAAVMSWRGTEGGTAAARQKHPVVMSPGSHCYFDHYQADPTFEPIAFGGYTPLKKVYAYEPVPAELTNAEATYVMGAQANIWTEYITSSDHVEYMAFPRLCALSEVLWTPKSLKNEADFLNRLSHHFTFLDQYKVNYSTSAFFPEVKTVRLNNGIGLEIKTSVLGDSTTCSITPAAMERLLTSFPVEVHDTVIAIHAPVKVRITAVNKSTPKAVKSGHFYVYSNKATGKTVSFATMPNSKYSTQPDFTLVDGIVAGLPKQNKQWLAWSGDDVEMVIDLGENQKISTVVIQMLQNQEDWIYLPSSISVEVSQDNQTFKPVKETEVKAGTQNLNQVEIEFKKRKTRYLKITAKNPGKIPEGKNGAGGESWMFFSEIMVD